MRAAWIEQVGGLPSLRDLPDPVRGEGQVLVEVRAAPLNPIDLSTAAGRFYGGLPDVPYVPGKEGVGRVLEGDSLEPGKRVWFLAPGGHGGDGALAERATVVEARAVELPEAIDDAPAACFGIAGLAAWLALEHRARLQEGETVLVLGASGAVGQVAIQAARVMGAGRVVAAARSLEGLERARALGADATVELGGGEAADVLGERLREAAGGGVDVSVDPLWGEPAVAAAHAAAKGGRIVQLGQSAGAEARLPSALVRGKALTILGHANAAVPHEITADAYRRMLGHAVAGRLAVAHEVLPLERVTEAWESQARSPGRKLVLAPYGHS